MLRALARSRRPVERGTFALYALLAGFALVCVATPLSGRLTGELERQHLFTPSSLASWCALALVPKTYAFAHRLWIGTAPIDDALVAGHAEPPGLLERHWLNHNPGRVTRFEGVRPWIRDEVRDTGALHLFMQTTYRGARRSQAFTVHLEDGVLVVRRAGAN